MKSLSFSPIFSDIAFMDAEKRPKLIVGHNSRKSCDKHRCPASPEAGRNHYFNSPNITSIVGAFYLCKWRLHNLASQLTEVFQLCHRAFILGMASCTTQLSAPHYFRSNQFSSFKSLMNRKSLRLSVTKVISLASAVTPIIKSNSS